MPDTKKSHAESPTPNSHPRIALVCDWLTTPGGAEKVLLELHHMYPEAPIYTSQYRPKKINWFDNATVHTGWLQFFPACLRKVLGPLRQLYFSHLDLSQFDLVISVTGAEAKGVKTKGANHSAKHLCYCHVPTQYYWQMYHQYLENPGFGPLNPLVRFFFKLLVAPLRRADLVASTRPDQFVAISTYAAEQIQIAYHRDSKIIYPPVSTKDFSPHPASSASDKTSAHSSSTLPESSPELSQYYIIACRQVTWKRVDLAIQACLEEHLPLWVVGDGPEHRHLQKLAQGSPLIHFIPWSNAAELSRYLQNATAYIFPSREPFGVAAVEALAAGCPVIAYDEGGSKDIITPGKNGIFFSQQTVESLRRGLEAFRELTFDPAAVRESAAKFDRSEFRRKIQRLVDENISPDSPRSPSSEDQLPLKQIAKTNNPKGKNE